VEQIIHKYLMPAMDEVGRCFEAGDFFISEMLMSARAMQVGMAVLKPLIVGAKIRTLGCVVIGTVQGDLHDIGKALVAMMLEGAGFEVHDLGVDVKPERFVETVRNVKPCMVAMSALLTTTIPAMQTTIEALKRAGLRDSVVVMVGGAPLTPQYAASIGADGYAEDAAAAARKAKELLRRRLAPRSMGAEVTGRRLPEMKPWLLWPPSCF
jgi:5-methyltetrahydrofolate--homocysteine methyltransferase